MADEPSPEEARRLWLTGRYDEAADLYAKLPDEHAVARAVGVARCRAAHGKIDEAVEALVTAAKENPRVAELPAELAALAFERGDRDEADKQSAAALKLDPDQPAARWIRAELLRTSGDMKGSDRAYKWFVDHYNEADAIDDPETLHYVGLAAAQYARWNRLSEQFSFLVNDLYPDIEKLEKEYWPARYEAGRLFLEKYNQADAQKELKAAQAINPNSAVIHAALAELAIQNYELEQAQRLLSRATEINPNYLPVKWMLADVHLSNFEPAKAARVLEASRKLNPSSESTLGRLAACYGMLDGLSDEKPPERMARLIDEAESRNPHCGEFYFVLAGSLDKGRKFPQAARYFARAVEVMPELVGARGQLGLMHMRLGEEDAARRVLDESFDDDPFNVRVNNSLKVLEVLDGYATIETPHFIIRYDAAKDEVAARMAAAYLEEIYPELCQRLGFEPPEKTLFEIFNRAKNTDGHGWFSARMVGLPAIHTIGACAGKIVALTSPTSMKQQFHWARVLRHEFVHVINLQQTDFNIPHWFTEGLAVMIEDLPRSAEWDAMLARRVAAGEVFDLDTINLGFIRPLSSDDWQMAYCQAELYAEFMVERFGRDSIGKMLACYRDNLGTREAIKRTFGVKQEEFEKGYTAHVKKIVDGLSSDGAGDEKKAPRSFAELKKAAVAAPDNMELAAELALALLQRGETAKAGPLAVKVLENEPKNQVAAYVRAKLLLSIGEESQAVAMLENALDRDKPRSEILKLLAGLRFREKDYAAAESLYKLGAEKQPAATEWTKALAMIYLKTGEKEKLAAAMERLAKAEADDASYRKKLAQLAHEAGDHAAAARWAKDSLYIDVTDVRMHTLLAESLAAQSKHTEAAEAYKLAILLAPDDEDLRLALVNELIETDNRDEARASLAELLKRSPKNEEAKKMLEKLKE